MRPGFSAAAPWSAFRIGDRRTLQGESRSRLASPPRAGPIERLAPFYLFVARPRRSRQRAVGFARPFQWLGSTGSADLPVFRSMVLPKRDPRERPMNFPAATRPERFESTCSESCSHKSACWSPRASVFVFFSIASRVSSCSLVFFRVNSFRLWLDVFRLSAWTPEPAVARQELDRARFPESRRSSRNAV